MSSSGANLDALYAPQDGNGLPNGDLAFPREIAILDTPYNTGWLALSFVTATRTRQISKLLAWTGLTAAAATPTLCKMALFSADASNNLTLISATANDPTLFTTISTAYTPALLTPSTVSRGSRYAIGLLVVSAAATPSFVGAGAPTTQGAVIGDALPELWSVVLAQTDIPATVPVSHLAAIGRIYQMGISA